MGLEAVVLSLTQITAVVAMGFFLWHVFSKRFDLIDGQIKGVEGRFEQVDARFAQVDARFAQVDARFAQVDARFEKIDDRFVAIESKIAELAKDHQILARELSEFRGEVRGRLDALAPRLAADA